MEDEMNPFNFVSKAIVIFGLVLISSVSGWGDGGSNDSCNGEMISELHSISATTSHTESGTLYDGSGSDDDNDYYYFTPGIAGTLSVTSYEANHDTDLYISTVSCGSDKVLNNDTTYSTNSPHISVGSTDTVYIRVKRERDNKTTSYSIPMTFTPKSTCLGTTGLCGHYYNNTSFSGIETLQRDDANINFDWGEGRPDPSIDKDNFSVAWNGFLNIPENATYTFNIQHDDDFKLIVNNVTLYDRNYRDYRNWYDSSTIVLSHGCYPISINMVEYGGGALAKLQWRNTGTISSNTIIPAANFVRSCTGADLKLSEYILPSPSYADINEDIHFSVRANNLGTLDANNTQLVVTYNQDVNITSASQNNGSDFNCTIDTGLLLAGTPITCSMAGILVNGATNKDFSFVVQATSLGELVQTSVISSDISDPSTDNNTLISTAVTIRTPAYCERHNISQSGYYIVDPDGDNNATNAFEIYCDISNPNNIKDIIKLPLSYEMETTEFSNFKFNSSLGTDKNYYDDANTKTYISYIRINANTLEIIPDSTPGFFDGDFSNLNLRGTPFTFDWDRMTDANISGCTLNKMRRDYDTVTKKGGQVLKINPKSENVYKCGGNNLQLKLLSEYKFIKYDNVEVLKKTCKILSEALPNTAEYDNMTGYFYIDPKLGGRSGNQSLSDYRPFVSYCMEVEGSNPEDQYAWTMFLTLDGVRTENHSDIANKTDTCSNLGLFFFVPNSQVTFGKAKAFLYDQKAQWAPYTGKMGEYFSDRNIAGWGTNHETTRDYWPYGPMGLYYDDGSTSDGILDPGSAGSWTSITGGITINSHKYGYDLTSSSEVNSTSINIAHISTGTGWKTTLEELGYPADFWITTYSAGSFYNSAPVCTGGNTNGCYLTSGSAEPNGDYTYGNWMHFWADENGDIYHYNDQGYSGTINDRYRHDHYMCIAEDNYIFVKRYDLIAGPFKAIEHSVIVGNETSNTALTTKIVNDTLHFDIALLNDSLSAVEADKNISVGIFLNDTYMDGFTETTRDIHYFGDIQMDGTGTFNSLKTTGRFELPPSSWPSGNQTWASANKRMFFKFKYCSRSDYEWTQCWTPSASGLSATCTAGKESYCKTADSDDFAIRPDKYNANTSSASLKAGAIHDVTFTADDMIDAPTNNYNETIIIDHNETINGCLEGLFTPLLDTITLTDGTTSFGLKYSEVGVISFKIEETIGSEFAIIDASDTSDLERLITPYDSNWTYSPDHFALTTTLTQDGGTFTYLSNDFDMATTLDINITAQTFNNTTTTNYNSACYAQATDYNISYSTLAVTPTGALSKIMYFETNTTTDGNVNINTDISLLAIPKTIFSTDTNGTGSIHVKINFDRNTSKVVNPFILTIQDINATDTNNTRGTMTLDQNATFQYGRVHAPDYRFAGSDGNATIYYEVYSDTSKSIRNSMDINGSESSDSINWYVKNLHVTADGDVLLFNSIGDVQFGNTIYLNAFPTSISEPITSGSELQIVSIDEVPYKDKIIMRPNTWLIFDAFNSTASTDDFLVEFYEAGSVWAGQGSLGQTVDLNVSRKQNKRLDW